MWFNDAINGEYEYYSCVCIVFEIGNLMLTVRGATIGVISGNDQRPAAELGLCVGGCVRTCKPHISCVVEDRCELSSVMCRLAEARQTHTHGIVGQHRRTA